MLKSMRVRDKLLIFDLLSETTRNVTMSGLVDDAEPGEPNVFMSRKDQRPQRGVARHAEMEIERWLTCLRLSHMHVAQL